VQELAVNAFFGPIMRGAAGTLGRPVDQHSAAVLKASLAPQAGHFWCCAVCCTGGARVKRTGSASQLAAVCMRRCSASAMMGS
jgi:hypothetical protein